jgi:WhiB family redox-sensing transcriptional regulator
MSQNATATAGAAQVSSQPSAASARGDPATASLPLPLPLATSCLAGLDGVAADPDLGRALLPCHNEDADLWFSESPAEVERARALCGPCQLRTACLAGAIERREPWGVWGGEIFVSGVIVPVKRGRGRPRKTPA